MALGLLPGWAGAVPHPAPARAGASDSYWRDLLTILDAIDRVLAGDTPLRGIPPVATELDALTWAHETESRFEQAGIDPDLNPLEVQQGLADVAAARDTIHANPDMFTDPYWESFLGTLDVLESELRAVQSTRS